MTQFEDRKGFPFQEETEIVNKVVSSFITYNDARSSNLDKANSLINEIFFKNTYSSESDKHKRWKSKVKMCKMFMFYQTLKAFIWKNIYSNVITDYMELMNNGQKNVSAEDFAKYIKQMESENYDE